MDDDTERVTGMPAATDESAQKGAHGSCRTWCRTWRLRGLGRAECSQGKQGETNDVLCTEGERVESMKLELELARHTQSEAQVCGLSRTDVPLTWPLLSFAAAVRCHAPRR